MSSEETVEQPTGQEHRLSAPCEREFCGRDVIEDILVPIHVGDTQHRWCPSCVEEEFGLDYAEYTNESPVARAVTWQLAAVAIVSFLLGVLLMLLVASVMVV